MDFDLIGRARVFHWGGPPSRRDWTVRPWAVFLSGRKRWA